MALSSHGGARYYDMERLQVGYREEAPCERESGRHLRNLELPLLRLELGVGQFWVTSEDRLLTLRLSVADTS